MQVFTRNDLKNIHLNLQIQIQNVTSVIITEVIEKATYSPGNNQYQKCNWDYLKLNNYMMDEICRLLRLTFTDSSIYFVSIDNHPRLIVDWS